MSTSSAHAEYYPYHGDLSHIPWECTTNEDKRYLKERIHDIEQCRVYVDHERKTIDWIATYAWIEEGMRALPQPPPPYRAYLLDTKTDSHHPRIRKVKDAQYAPQLQASHPSHTKTEHPRRRWGHFAFGRSNSKGK